MASQPKYDEGLTFFPSGPGDRATPIEWPAPGATIPLRNGEQAHYLGRCPITRKHRVVPPSLTKGAWLLDDAGRCRCSPGPSDHDYVPGAKVPA